MHAQRGRIVICGWCKRFYGASMFYWLMLRAITVQIVNSSTSRPDVCQCLVGQIPIDNMSKNKPSTSMTRVASESKLCSVVRSFIHP